MLRALFVSLAFLVFCQTTFSQSIYLPINRWQNLKVTQYLLETDSLLHNEIQPFTTFSTNIDREKHKEILGIRPRRTWFGRKLKSENLVEFKNKDLFFTFDILYDLKAGSDDFSIDRTYQNTRAFMVNGEINKKVSFFTSFYENQARYPLFIANYVNKYDVVPGNGRVKKLGASEFDFAMSSAMLNIDLKKWFNIQLGHHKNFIGNGYRSLLLSDNAFNYPHLKLIFKSPNKKWVYQNIYASLINLTRLPATTSSEPQFERKAATFHYLSFRPNKFLSVGLFEGNIWQRRNSEGTIPFNFNYLNPLMFFNSTLSGFDKHQTNNTLGLNFSVNPINNLQLYGQYAIGEFSKFSKGFQVGLKYNKSLIIGDISILTELNQADQNLYNGTNNLNYNHYNQPLAFVPITSNKELVVLVDYSLMDFFIATKYSRGTQNDFSIEVREFVRGEFGYLFNPLTGLKLSVSYTGRTNFDTSADTFGDANWFSVNFSTTINRVFSDF